MVGAVAMVFGIAGTAAGVTPAGANPTPGTFSGSCNFSGPIKPDPPITVIPKSGSKFSYAGTGTCTGTLDGAAVTTAPDSVTFMNVSTAFDTCEFGPDFNLAGQLTIVTASTEVNFAVVISLARLAVAGPFSVTTTGGGEGLGTATFTPPSTAGALQQCAGSGISTATLAGSFNTTAPLVGTVDTAATMAQAPVCPAPGRLTIRLLAAHGRRIVRTVVYVNGRRVAVISGNKRTSITLKRLPVGIDEVKVVTRFRRGRSRTTTGAYTVCSNLS